MYCGALEIFLLLLLLFCFVTKVVRVDAELYQYLAARRSSGLLPANCLDPSAQHQPHQQIIIPANGNNGVTLSEHNDSGSCRAPPGGVARAAQYATSSG